MIPWPEPLTPTPPPRNKYVGSIVLDNGAQPSEIVNQTELDSAMADMRAAEKILHQRHAAIKPQQNIGKKMKSLKPVIKQDGAKDVSPQYGRGPPVPTKDTCSVSQRRQLIKNLAFDAVHGCPTAMAIMNQVNCHSTFKAGGLHDLVLMINGKSIHMALCGIVEHNWITRFNAFTDNIALVDRRAMALEDHEEIVTQLFPETRNDILRPEHFRVFVLGLGEEGILTMSQAKAIARLGVSIDEFDRGANFDGSSKQVCYNRHHAMLQIPDQSSRDISSCSLQPIRSQSCNIHDYLLTLVEATVYDQETWQGYNCANARSQFDRVYDAYELDMQDWLLPAHLTEYKRSWNYREQRLLQRARIICELLDQYKSGKLSDFGIIRAIRGTYIQIPAQPYFSAEDLESFLYHRVTDSGLSVSRIPDILILHPDNDAAFAKPRLRNYVMNSLKDRAYEFKREEEQRLNDIKISCLSFKMAQNSQMTPWQRLKTRFRRMFGKEEVAPFDPFAPQHDVKSERR
ncbi:hypothetical protein BKA66DRAFT_481160 [Pyrenochaeta sp. MPI-SDFR-AT-0127]|nr:hypothetical protein BKA66DRAFT_481160 [Pyrenochaeta sp. MPI-SDFR-AT-0127]